MDFTRTDTPPATNAPVTVTFSGLMILRPGPNNTCEVGVHRWTHNHTFQVMLVVQKPDRPASLVRLLSGPLSYPLSIRLESDPPGNFQAYAATAGELERNDHNAERYRLDYRWVLNLKERHYNADWNGGVQPLVTLKTGVLYTSNLTPKGLNPRYERPNPPNPPLKFDLKYFAADLAAAIVRPPGAKVRLEWTELGVPQEMTLPRDQDNPDTTTYVVSLINEPPMSYPPSHDELALYYNVLTAGGAPIPVSARWQLRYDAAQRLDEIPCMPTSIEP